MSNPENTVLTTFCKFILSVLFLAAVAGATSAQAPPPIMRFSPSIYYEYEGNTAVISVARADNSNETGSINYSTVSLSAKGGASCAIPGVDYVQTAGRLTFNPGETVKTFTVQICNDALPEANETVRLVFSYDFPTITAELGTLIIVGKTPAGSDFDSDRRSDVSLFRPSNNTWYIAQSQSGTLKAVQFGLATDQLVPADYDGDGKTDVAVFRNGVWYWLNSSNNSFSAHQFGTSGDVPVPFDYTGDGRAELAVYRSGIWYTLNLSTDQFLYTRFGAQSDKPVPADFDGDGRTDFAVYRDGNWYWLRSLDLRMGAVQFGIASDKPVVGDYDGDARADQAVYRNGAWYILGSTQGFYATQFGLSSDVPAAADFDGDGKTDVAVFRNGFWYLLRSQQGFTTVQFGAVNDRPIPATFLP